MVRNLELGTTKSIALIRPLVFGLFFWMSWIGAAWAEKNTMKEIFEQLEHSHLAKEFYIETSMEPMPSGEYILEELHIDRSGKSVDYEHVAGDGAGGAYIVLDDGRLMLIGSEGSAAVLGSSLLEGIETILFVGSWGDASRFAGGPDMNAARNAWNIYRDSWGIPEGPDDKIAVEKILQLIDIVEPGDPFGKLFSAISSGDDLTINGPHGKFAQAGNPAQWPQPKPSK